MPAHEWVSAKIYQSTRDNLDEIKAILMARAAEHDLPVEIGLGRLLDDIVKDRLEAERQRVDAQNESEQES